MSAERVTQGRRRTGTAGDGRWMLLWPLSTAIGVWGMALVYRGLGNGHELWPGIALLAGGWLLTGRWLAQARHMYRNHTARVPGPSEGGGRSTSRERRGPTRPAVGTSRPGDRGLRGGHHMAPQSVRARHEGDRP